MVEDRAPTLFRGLWGYKWLISGLTLLCAALSAAVSLLQPDVYRADVLVTPNNVNGMNTQSTLLSQFTGLAGMADSDFGGSGTNRTAVGLEILKSRKFISSFIERREILVPLMASKGWRANRNTLILDESLYDQNSEKWIRRSIPPKSTVPSALEAHEKFLDHLDIAKDEQSGFIRISFAHYSPYIAKRWLEWLITDLNKEMMRIDVSEAKQAVNYLNEQIQESSIAELERLFYDLIEEQTRKIMLAEVSKEYLFRTVDPPVVPEYKFKPRRTLIILSAAIFGFFSGVATAILQMSMARKRG